MRALILDGNVDLDPLDRELLDADGRMRLLPAAEFDKWSWEELRVWCHFRCRYGLITQELIDWLRDRIGGRKAIEIGAGMGDLGRQLGIPMTDSAFQTRPEIRALYAVAQQPTIDPPTDVIRCDASEAIRLYGPEVVVASWVTQLYKPGDERPPKIGSMVDGIDELKLLRDVGTYIHIGATTTHSQKRVLKFTHSTVNASWLRSRAPQHANCIWIWDRS